MVYDWAGTYPTGSVTDPIGPSSGSEKVRRGGSWYQSHVAKYCRSAARSGGGSKTYTSTAQGLRLLRMVNP